MTKERGEPVDPPIVIPALQREFCWDRKQITTLFDSLLRGLPIGSLLLWHVTRDSLAETEATYEFIQRYANSSKFPASKWTQSNDRRYVRNTSAKLDDGRINAPVQFALDGQQRLTALLIGLSGRFYKHKKNHKYRKWDSYTPMRLCLDLLSDPNAERDAQDHHYQFKFRDESYGRLSDNEKEYWWPVEEFRSIINDDTTDNAGIDRIVNEVISERSVDEPSADTVESNVRANLERLAKTLTDDTRLQYERVTGMDSETAVELFVRRNDAGEPLGNEDIAFSLMSVYWDNVDTLDIDSPKEAIEEFNTGLSQQFGAYGFGFGKRFTIRALLTLADEEPSFRRRNFSPATMEKTGKTWENSSFQRALKDAFTVITEDLRLSSKCLTSKTAVLPICYYFHRHHKNGGTELPTDLVYQFDRWLCATVFNNVLEQGPKQVLEPAQELIEKHYPRFPTTELLNTIEREDDSFELTYQRLSTILADTDYRGNSARLHLFLSRLYTDRIGGVVPLERIHNEENNAQPVQIDHIYPQGELSYDPESDDEGSLADVDEEVRATCSEYKHSLVNLQLIPENQEKSDRNPSDWLARDDDQLSERIERHYLPFDNPDDYEYARFDEFCRKRGRAITYHFFRKNRIPMSADEPTLASTE
ncbi:DUF262 domain-containing protein [Halosimplex sp. J119]